MTSPASSVDRDGRDERVRTWAGGIGVCACDCCGVCWEEEDDEASAADVWEGESDAAKDVARCSCCRCLCGCCPTMPSDMAACCPDDDIIASNRNAVAGTSSLLLDQGGGWYCIPNRGRAGWKLVSPSFRLESNRSKRSDKGAAQGTTAAATVNARCAQPPTAPGGKRESMQMPRCSDGASVFQCEYSEALLFGHATKPGTRRAGLGAMKEGCGTKISLDENENELPMQA